MKRSCSLIIAVLMLFALAPMGLADGDGGLIPIYELRIDGFGLPVPGEPIGSQNALYVPEGAPYFISASYWYDRTTGDIPTETELFSAGHEYQQGAMLEPAEGYFFADDMTVTHDGSTDFYSVTIEAGCFCTVWNNGVVCADLTGPDPISEICVYGFTAPLEGLSAEELTALFLPEGACYSIVFSGWREAESGGILAPEERFLPGKAYAEFAVVAPAEGRCFAQDCVFLVNGLAELADVSTCMLLTGDPETEGFALISSLPSFVPLGLPGDADHNGEINTLDALIVLRCVLLLEGEEENLMPLCDMDSNAVLDTVDALLILRAAVGL